MRARAYWKAVTADRAEFLDRPIGLLMKHGIPYCIVGGQAVNAYAEPVVSLDLVLVIAGDHLPTAAALLRQDFAVEEFSHSLNVSAPDSDLRIQIQTDPRHVPFVERAAPRTLLGIPLVVARLEDVLQGKVWAAMDPSRRASKRQEDLADIARILEAHPSLREQVPAEVLAKLL